MTQQVMQPEIQKRPMVPNRDYTFYCPGGYPLATAWSPPVELANTSHFWHVIAALATEPVWIQFIDGMPGILQRNVGNIGERRSGFKLMQVATISPQTVVISCGDDVETDTSRFSSTSGSSAGPVPFGTQAPEATFGNPSPGEMLKNNGDGTFTNDPFQTIDGQGLITEQIPNVEFGFLMQPGQAIDVRLFNWITVVVYRNDPSTACFITDSQGYTLWSYIASSALTGAPNQSIVADITVGSRYYVPCVGVASIIFTCANANTWQFKVGGGACGWV